MGALDHPFGVLLLDGTSVTHPADILAGLDETDTVMARGGPRLAYPIIPHDRLGEMWRTSVLESDSPDFLDTGNPELCLGMPEPRGCVWDIELVCDTALLGRGCLPGLRCPGISCRDSLRCRPPIRFGRTGAI